MSLDLSHLCIGNDGGSVGRVYYGIYHSDGGVDDDKSKDEEQWLYLAEDMDVDWEAALLNAIEHASKNGISNEGRIKLEHIIREFRDVIRLRLNNRDPAIVKPIKIHLKPNSVLFRAPQTKHSPEKREFMDQYVDYLLKLGLAVATEDPKWVRAPNIIRKNIPAMFRMAIDYCPVKVATVPIFWAMLDIKKKLSDVKGSKCFCGIDFCSGYWQLPLEGNSKPLHAFMTPRGVVNQRAQRKEQSFQPLTFKKSRAVVRRTT